MLLPSFHAGRELLATIMFFCKIFWIYIYCHDSYWILNPLLLVFFKYLSSYPLSYLIPSSPLMHIWYVSLFCSWNQIYSFHHFCFADSLAFPNCCFFPFTFSSVLTMTAGESKSNQLLPESGYLGELIESMHCLEALVITHKRICLYINFW